MSYDPYEDIADRNELFYESDPEIVEFFRRLFFDNHVHKVLDCACGTGRKLLLFHSLGRDVVDSDLSESMLTEAQRNPDKGGISVPLHKVDYRELPQLFSERFVAVVCWSAAIFHLPNDDETSRAFHSMRTVLAKDGILVLDQGMTDKHGTRKAVHS